MIFYSILRLAATLSLAFSAAADPPTSGSLRVRLIRGHNAFKTSAQPRDGFQFAPDTGVSNRVLTPNGDGLNDNVVFTFDNPRDSNVSGEIFDIHGAKVADLTQGPMVNTLLWDGKAEGTPVPSGVYIYQLRSENRIFNGTLVVVR